MVGVDDQPDAPVAFTAAVYEQATEEHPPRLTVSVENESDVDYFVGEWRTVQFRKVACDDGALLLLASANRESKRVAGDGCWRLEEPLPDWESYNVTEFESGEILERELDLYGHPDQPEDACLEPGEHHFGVGFAYAESHTDVQSKDPMGSWGFTIQVGN